MILFGGGVIGATFVGKETRGGPCPKNDAREKTGRRRLGWEKKKGTPSGKKKAISKGAILTKEETSRGQSREGRGRSNKGIRKHHVNGAGGASRGGEGR